VFEIRFSRKASVPAQIDRSAGGADPCGANRSARTASVSRRRPRVGERRWTGDTVRAVAPLTPEQLRRREQVETLIRLAAPGLNVVLAAGDCLARLLEREDTEYYAPRPRAGAEPPPVPTPGAGEARGE
jgi:hypothetical protein